MSVIIHEVSFMEKYITQKIKELHLLSSWHLETMNELAKDLNEALDASSDIQNVDNTRKHKGRTFVKTKSLPSFGNSSVKMSQLKSDDSESSMDAWIQGKLNFSTNHTDTDDRWGCKVNSHDHPISTWRQYAANVGESDSLNENLCQSRELRRKRKFKRMTVDPPYVAENEGVTLPCVTTFSQKNKRLRNRKSTKLSKLSVKSPKLSKIKTVSQISSKMDDLSMDFKNTVTSSGKRKRCAHERSVECNGCDCKGMNSGKGIASYPCRHSDCSNSKPQDINSSGLSSSESECEALTNDESREADDEHSDFFQESGPSYGVPNFSMWWDENDFIPYDEQFSDPKFDAILSEKFCDLSEAAKRMFAERYKQRQIKSGRRRLGNRVVSTDCNTEEMLPYRPFTNEISCISSSVDSCLTRTPNEKKKRRGMPSSVSAHEFLEVPVSNIPSTNLNFQVYKNWVPGAILGRSGEGIISPTKTCVNAEKWGLEYVYKNSENIILPSSVIYANTGSPPPPPLSPQSLVIKKENDF